MLPRLLRPRISKTSTSRASTTAAQIRRGGEPVRGHTRVDDVFQRQHAREVTVNRKDPGFFLQLWSSIAGGSDIEPTIRARATAQIAQMGPSHRHAPGRFHARFVHDRREQRDQDEPIRAASNKGAFDPDNSPPSCYKSTGAADFRSLLTSKAFGGVDACAHKIGSIVSTETGNMSGPTRQGLDARIGPNGINSERFTDVLRKQAVGNRYIVLKPNSPRIGYVPVIETRGRFECMAQRPEERANPLLRDGVHRQGRSIR